MAERETRSVRPPIDLAGESYWTREWESRKIRRSVDLRNFVSSRFDAFFLRHLAGMSGDLLEVGCAGSVWLPYFNLRFGLSVHGIDYSNVGCQQSEEILKAHGVRGTIQCRDVFQGDDDLRARFRVVFSYGVAEHFSPPEVLVARLRELCAPGGLVLTVVPNMCGLPGAVQRTVDLEVFRRHVPLSREDLDRVHRVAGFTPLETRYLGSFSWGVPKYPRHGLWPRSVRRVYKIRSLITWRFLRITGWYPESKLFSPYVVCAAVAADKSD
jgi:2-polyprenyl-3-methyl-5-hydroxy-6-metoxy-1,4-benzoquinol methylase